MSGGPQRTSYVIAGILILLSLLVCLGGLVPILDCPYCGPGKTIHRDWLRPDGYLCLCKKGRVSLIYWWKIKHEMEKPPDPSPHGSLRIPVADLPSDSPLRRRYSPTAVS